jgi:hypothetical protein
MFEIVSRDAASSSLTILLFISLSVVCGLVFSVVARLDTRSPAPFGAGGGRLGLSRPRLLLFVELAARSGADVSLFHQIPADAFSVKSWAAPLRFFACMGGILGTIFAPRQRRATAAGDATRTFLTSAVALIGLLTLHIGNPDNTDMLEVGRWRSRRCCLCELGGAHGFEIGDGAKDVNAVTFKYQLGKGPAAKKFKTLARCFAVKAT